MNVCYVFIFAPRAGFVLHFLIRYAHKNAGCGSTVSISRNEIETYLRRSNPDENDPGHFLSRQEHKKNQTLCLVFLLAPLGGGRSNR